MSNQPPPAMPGSPSVNAAAKLKAGDFAEQIAQRPLGLNASQTYRKTICIERLGERNKLAFAFSCFETVEHEEEAAFGYVVRSLLSCLRILRHVHYVVSPPETLKGSLEQGSEVDKASRKLRCQSSKINSRHIADERSRRPLKCSSRSRRTPAGSK